MNHGSTEDTETATENCKDLVGVPFTLKLFFRVFRAFFRVFRG